MTCERDWAGSIPSIFDKSTPCHGKRMYIFSIRHVHSGQIYNGSMPTCDLHVHTNASIDTISWPVTRNVRPLLDAVASYELAKSRGMEYVTFTDHDTIEGARELELELGNLPKDFFTSVEISSKNPYTGHSVHVNAFDITPDQHQRTQELRNDLVALTKYLVREGVLYAWNHPVWDEKGVPPSQTDLERLLPLFPAVEVRNGTRREHLNAVAEALAISGMKARTAGSDSHTDGIGTTWTEAPGATLKEYLENVRAGYGVAHGEHGTRHRFVHDITALTHATLRHAEDETSSAVRRGGYRALRRIAGRAVPLVIDMYHKKQDAQLLRAHGAA